MNKTALFVEGQTEMIFVRELLLKIFEPDRLIIECFNLFNDLFPEPTHYSHQGKNADLFFLINNIGNDQKVLSSLLKRQALLLGRGGFGRIIGLRDMYGKEYNDLSADERVDRELIRRFIQSHRDQIKYHAERSQDIYFCFAIMEVEAWFMGFDQLYPRLSKRYSKALLQEKMGINLSKTDPERSFHHPTATLTELWALLGMKYNKSAKTIEQFAKSIHANDIERLLHSGRCASFRFFYQALTWEGYLLSPQG